MAYQPPPRPPPAAPRTDRPLIEPFFLSPPGDLLIRYLIRQRDLEASLHTSFPSVRGITDGVGNQGSGNSAHLIGHAGTGLGQLQLPRSVAFGRQQSV